MPGERLRWYHVAGAVLGLAGTFLIVTNGGSLSFDSRYVFGYAMAGACAFIWAAYSLLSRRFPSVPTTVVTWFCAASSVLSLVCHLLLEETVLPASAGEWLAVLGLGLAVSAVLALVPASGPHRSVRVTARTATVLVGAVLALAIGLSRAYLGVHWTTDVAAGWLLGGALLALAVGAAAVVEAEQPDIHRSEGVPAPPLR